LTDALVSNSIGKVKANLHYTGNTLEYYILEGGNSHSDNVLFFTHPLYFKTGSKDKHGQPIYKLAVDLRNYGKYSPTVGRFTIRNVPEYNWSTERVLLNELWISGTIDTLRDISPIPVLTYANLISECLAKRFALNLAEQFRCNIISSYFYYNLFTNNKVYDETEYNRIVLTIGRVLKIETDTVYDTLEFLNKKTISDISELTDTIKTSVQNESMKHLNLGMLLAITTSTWFGTNAKEILAVGLEHPPTWLMIVYASINEATFKRSVLSKISARFDKGGAGDTFVKAMKSLLQVTN
jgi:hypothetical protein